MMKRSVALAAALSMLTACNDQPPVHTVEYYSQHTKEALAESNHCQELAVRDRGAECVNADQGILTAVYSSRGSVRP